MPYALLLLFSLSLMLFACDSKEPEAKGPADAAAAPGALQNKLDARRAQWAEKAPQATHEIYDQGIKAVDDAGVVESMKKVGDDAPDFTLPNAIGEDVALAELLKQGPVIVVFYRGAWCPYCNLTLAEWQGHLEEVQALGAQLVAISPQKPDHSLTSKNKNDLAFPVLSDTGHVVSDAFGVTTQITPEIIKLWEGKIDLEAHNGETSGKLPLPATYLIDQAGKIQFAHANIDYRVRAEPVDVIAKLRAIESK